MILDPARIWLFYLGIDIWAFLLVGRHTCVMTDLASRVEALASGLLSELL
jgi:hypothetical protein